MRVQESVAAGTRAKWCLAQLLARVIEAEVKVGTKTLSLTTSWGFSTWTAWVTSETGMCRKEAERLLFVWRRLGIELRDKVDPLLRDQLPWSKLRIVSSLAGLSDVNKWLKKAQTLTVRELEAIQSGRVESDWVRKSELHFLRFSVYFTKEEIELVDRKIRQVQSERGFTRKGEALALLLGARPKLRMVS
jgi:hypothetical protein